MKGPVEIRFHGRGGQGAKTASQLLVEAALYEGKQVQAYPEYGPERTGAPVRVFARISNQPIKSYAPISHPGVVVVIDETIAKTVDVAEGLGKDGILIINSAKSADEIRPLMKNFKGMIVTCDATSLSLKHLNRNIPNIAMLGVLIKVTGVITLQELNKRIKAHMQKKIGEEATNANIRMAKEAHDMTR